MNKVDNDALLLIHQVKVMKPTTKISTNKREGKFARIDTLITVFIFSTLILMSYHGLNSYEYPSENIL